MEDEGSVIYLTILDDDPPSLPPRMHGSVLYSEVYKMFIEGQISF